MSEEENNDLKRMRAMEEEVRLLKKERDAARQREEALKQETEAAVLARRQAEEAAATLKQEREAANLARRHAEEEVRQLRETALNPPAAPLSSYLPAPEVAKQFFASTPANIKWPKPADVKLERAQISANHKHASKFNANGDVFAVPGTKNFDPLLYKFVAQGLPLSKGDSLATFPGADGSKLVVILAPSGGGKSRKAAEWLRRNTCGIYLTYRGAEDDKNWGSRALSAVMWKLRSLAGVDVDWKTPVVKMEKNPLRPLFEERRYLVHFAMKCVLAAYYLVFTEWERRVHTSLGRKPTITPLQWLLVQLFPDHFFGDDIFKLLALQLLQRCDPRTDQTSVAFPKGSLPIKWPCAIDEAQEFGFQLKKPDSLGSQFADLFIARDHGSIRSLFSAVIIGTEEALHRYPVVLGTGLSLATEWKSVVSNAATQEGSFVFHDFPPLDVGEVRNLLTRLLVCENDPRLDEVVEMLVGRPRYTMYFVQQTLTRGLTVSEAMFGTDDYKGVLWEMTAPESTYARGPSGFFKQLNGVETFSEVGGQLVASSPLDAALEDTYWVSMGLGERIARDPSLIEIGLGYALPGGGEVVQAVIKAEAFILEAGRRLREKHPKWDTVLLHQTVDNASAMGKRFEYLATRFILPGLLGRGPLETSPLLAGLDVTTLPEKFRGSWEVPGWNCGRLAFSGAEAFPDALLAALRPNAEVVRVWFPDDLAGPDAVAVVRNDAKQRTMVIVLQYKLVSGKISVDEALHRVDLAKMYHYKRGKEPGRGKGKERVISGKEEGLKKLLAEVASREVPVIRLLFSGSSPLGAEHKTRMVPHKRGRGGEDLCVFIDAAASVRVFGAETADKIRELKVKS